MVIASRVAYAVYTAAAAFATGALGRPSSSPKEVHERRDVAHEQGWTKVGRAAADTPLTLRIGLKQRNLERADEFVRAVADPRSATYGRHWTPREVADMFAPSDDAVTDTEQWLVAEGVARDRISRSPGRNWVRVATTVSEAEALLDTVYNVYENDYIHGEDSNSAQIIACEAYSVPAAIRRHVDLVAPTIQFDEREAIVVTRAVRRSSVRREESLPPKFKKLSSSTALEDPESLDNCSERTTPACLRAQ